VRIIGTRTGAFEVRDVANLRALTVECTDPGTPELMLLEHGLGWIDGDHAWLNIEALERICGPQGQRWRDSYAEMIGYARAQGWIDRADAYVRAHIERSA